MRDDSIFSGIKEIPKITTNAGAELRAKMLKNIMAYNGCSHLTIEEYAERILNYYRFSY